MLNTPPLVLLILDGWGYSENTLNNAIAEADTPQWDQWWQKNPHTLLEASGPAVGLPHQQMGNSEVGHMHIGAGRIIEQDFTRINQAIASKAFDNNPVLLKAIQNIKQNHHTLHIMGLLSPGGVHSHEAHLFAFLDLCKQQGVHQLALHLFLDGRDTAPKSALDSVKRLEKKLDELPNAKICSLSGRYYAMDRDKRWDRIEPVYNLITEGESTTSFESADAAIRHYYQEDISDEFIPPTRIGTPCPIQDKDILFFFNFRADRARQLTECFVTPNFHAFSRKKMPALDTFLSMTQYANHLQTTAVFSPFQLHDTLGECLSKHQLRQLRIAETEKYAHVTFFLNGGSEHAFPLEERVLIPSPKVSTYDKQPEMSAPAITDAIVTAIQNQTHDVIICNYANADMVGHTGNFEATKKAITCLDHAMHRIAKALLPVQGQLLITADHGNAEAMYDEHTKLAHTAHTTHPVPLLYVGHKHIHFKPNIKGSLIDIAPTVLSLLNIEPPKSMRGHVLTDCESAS